MASYEKRDQTGSGKTFGTKISTVVQILEGYRKTQTQTQGAR